MDRLERISQEIRNMREYMETPEGLAAMTPEEWIQLLDCMFREFENVRKEVLGY